MHRWRSFRLLTLVAGVVCVLAHGCHQDDGATSPTAGAAATPSPFAPHSSRVVEKTEVRQTPTAAEAQPLLPSGGDAAPRISVRASADPDSGGAPLTVTLAGEIDGGVEGLRYRWDFGDRSVPAHQLSVQHTYQSPGEYIATLVASGPGVGDSDDVRIDVTEDGFDVEIEADPDIGKVPLTVNFAAVLDEDMPGPFYFEWAFGDGGRDASSPTAHTYRMAGQYTATLTVTNAQGQRASREVEVQVDPVE